MTGSNPVELYKSLVCYKVLAAEAVPDPQVPGVFLIFAETDQGDRAAILYQELQDFEEVDFTEAALKYGRNVKLIANKRFGGNVDSREYQAASWPGATGICCQCFEPVDSQELYQVRETGRKFHKRCFDQGGYYVELEKGRLP